MRYVKWIGLTVLGIFVTVMICIIASVIS